MDDRFKTIMRRSVRDAIDMYIEIDNQLDDDRDFEIGPQFIRDATMSLYENRSQKWMMKYQMQHQAQVRAQQMVNSDLDSGFGVQ